MEKEGDGFYSLESSRMLKDENSINRVRKFLYWENSNNI